ncbi:uncharacterized protein LOC130267707 isoform X2 [Hyla sarda]|uniref:uncharacterized protein LOC130267707 isoform X2 n=1 Tax=Hyla sarda TaxID=327740 RepID=UPI0024C3EA76|nr:uncharacterized protein LOC130267707 isoform X2 [Hyla sarda]
MELQSIWLKTMPATSGKTGCFYITADESGWKISKRELLYPSRTDANQSQIVTLVNQKRKGPVLESVNSRGFICRLNTVPVRRLENILCHLEASSRATVESGTWTNVTSSSTQLLLYQTTRIISMQGQGPERVSGVLRSPKVYHTATNPHPTDESQNLMKYRRRLQSFPGNKWRSYEILVINWCFPWFVTVPLMRCGCRKF